MSRYNWAESLSNSERELFTKGNWKLTIDGEKSWSLYYNDTFFSTICEYNQYRLFENGFLFMHQENGIGSYCLYASNSKKPLFVSNDDKTKFISESDFITFESGTEKAIFDAENLTRVSINEENQIGIEF